MREHLSAAGKMSLFLPVTETTPTQFQHPTKIFRYITLSNLPGEFHFVPLFSRLVQLDASLLILHWQVPSRRLGEFGMYQFWVVFS